MVICKGLVGAAFFAGFIDADAISRAFGSFLSLGPILSSGLVTSSGLQELIKQAVMKIIIKNIIFLKAKIIFNSNYPAYNKNPLINTENREYTT